MTEGKSAAKKTSVAKKPADHPKYLDMISAAIQSLKERSGSSRQAIQKYVSANYKVGESCGNHIKMALKRGVQSGTLVQVKGTGASGSFKIGKLKADAKPKSKKPVAKKPTAKKPVAKKPTAKKTTKKASTTPKKKKAPAKKNSSAKKPKSVAKKPTAAKKPKSKTTPKKKTAAKKGKK